VDVHVSDTYFVVARRGAHGLGRVPETPSEVAAAAVGEDPEHR
jgi:hypothetical protein